MKSFATSLQGEASGLTLGYRVLNEAGAEVVAYATAGIIERALGDGISNYFTPLLSLPDTAHVFVWHEDGAGVAGDELSCEPVIPLPAQAADVTASQTAITNAIAALNNLSQGQAAIAAAAALADYDPPTHDELIARTRAAGEYALETTLAALMGAGWTNETLKVIYDEIMKRLLTTAYTAPDNASIASNKQIIDKLNSMLEADGLLYRFTTNALEQAPAGGGGGGGGGFTDDDRADLQVTKAKVLTLGSAKVVIQSPVITNKNIEIVRGGDYKASFGRSFLFTFSELEALHGFIDHCGFIIQDEGFVKVEAEHEISDGSLIVSVDLPRATTELLDQQPPHYPFFIRAVLNNETTDIVPICSGSARVLAGGE